MAEKQFDFYFIIQGKFISNTLGFINFLHSSYSTPRQNINFSSNII
ncbi:hypothetical protein SAMN05444372_101173 [Flavobacterium micromati]|uniref:Uncharacterized protein n=1 Tax=Flavobacterium micromati TaxID=229205 RepID=A0A1M5FKE2_9FLAO|nr:hypothetical protein SAMN05444372_101173 [Flavobacterium micromati]